MKKPSIFQPDHSGKHRQVPVNPGMTVSHMSHGQAEHKGHHVPGNLPRDGAPKLNKPVPIHGGMVRHVQGAAITGGGHLASALDSLTGATVPAGRNTAQPGWGNSGVSDGNPLVKLPGPKSTLTRVQPSFGQASRTNDKLALHEIGEAILREAFEASATDDRMAHGRGRDGAKLPAVVEED